MGPLIFCLTIACSSLQIEAKSVSPTTQNTIEKPLLFLKKYGYLKEVYSYDTSNSQDGRILSDALKLYQKMSGLSATGNLDKDTLFMMSQPRCGMKDVEVMSESPGRLKRDIFKLLFGAVWSRWDLTYGITSAPTRLSKESAEDIVGKALKLWGDASPLRFARSSDPMIDIKFLQGNHGDEFAFDGKGNVLAHAFYPGFFTGPNGGDVHFDDEEEWTDDSFVGKNLLQVALHEGGHSLGLRHSMNPEAIMAPVYKGYNPNVKLHPEDVANVQELYGPYPNSKSSSKTDIMTDITTTTDDSKTTTLTMTMTQSTTTSKSTTTTPIPCKIAPLDAIIKAENGDQWTFFAFSGLLVYSLRGGQIDDGFPIHISSVFPWLSGPVDAAITWPEIRSWTSTCGAPSCYRLQLVPPVALIFKSNLVYKYELSLNSTKYLGVHYLSSLFPGIRGKVEAGFFHYFSGYTYLFTDMEVYKLSSRSSLTNQGGVIQTGWPRPLQDFNIPENVSVINAAVQHYNRDIYLFFKDDFYKLNETNHMLDVNNPKNIQQYWFACDYGEGSVLPMGELMDKSSSSNYLYLSHICIIFVMFTVCCKNVVK